jgi:hypothetical protein
MYKKQSSKIYKFIQCIKDTRINLLNFLHILKYKRYTVSKFENNTNVFSVLTSMIKPIQKILLIKNDDNHHVLCLSWNQKNKKSDKKKNYSNYKPNKNNNEIIVLSLHVYNNTMKKIDVQKIIFNLKEAKPAMNKNMK